MDADHVSLYIVHVNQSLLFTSYTAILPVHDGGKLPAKVQEPLMTFRPSAFSIGKTNATIIFDFLCG
jgi:hypothetical protein